MWDESKQKCYICHDIIFNESDFKRSSRKSECETQEPEKNIQINLDYQQEEEVPDDDQSDETYPDVLIESGNHAFVMVLMSMSTMLLFERQRLRNHPILKKHYLVVTQKSGKQQLTLSINH